MEKRETSCTVGGKTTMENIMEIPLKKKKKLGKNYHMTQQSHLGICPEKTIVQKVTCMPVFTVTLFTTVRIWKQPRSLSTDECIKKLRYIYTME